MSTIKKLLFFIVIILVLNILIYWRALVTLEFDNLVFAECARNSGRTSAALNLTMLMMIGFYGSKRIFMNPAKVSTFRILATLFTVNHLVHFFFVSLNFKSQHTPLEISENIHGFVTFISIILFPFAVWTIKSINTTFGILIVIHLTNVTFLISKTFYGRYNHEDPAYLHRIGVLVMIGAVLYMLYGTLKEIFSSRRTVQSGKPE